MPEHLNWLPADTEAVLFVESPPETYWENLGRDSLFETQYDSSVQRGIVVTERLGDRAVERYQHRHHTDTFEWAINLLLEDQLFGGTYEQDFFSIARHTLTSVIAAARAIKDAPAHADKASVDGDVELREPTSQFDAAVLLHFSGGVPSALLKLLERRATTGFVIEGIKVFESRVSRALPPGRTIWHVELTDHVLGVFDSQMLMRDVVRRSRPSAPSAGMEASLTHGRAWPEVDFTSTIWGVRVYHVGASASVSSLRLYEPDAVSVTMQWDSAEPTERTLRYVLRANGGAEAIFKYWREVLRPDLAGEPEGRIRVTGGHNSHLVRTAILPDAFDAWEDRFVLGFVAIAPGNLARYGIRF